MRRGRPRERDQEIEIKICERSNIMSENKGQGWWPDSPGLSISMNSGVLCQSRKWRGGARLGKDNDSILNKLSFKWLVYYRCSINIYRLNEFSRKKMPSISGIGTLLARMGPCPTMDWEGPGRERRGREGCILKAWVLCEIIQGTQKYFFALEKVIYELWW